MTAEIEYRCHTCLLPVALPTDEFCSENCRLSSDEYEEQHIVYSSEAAS